MRLRILLAAAAIAGVAASPLPFQPEATAASAVSGVVMTALPKLLETPHRHSAFPGAALRPDGVLVAVWRGGTDHYLTRDGVIVRAESHDLGKTWTTPTVVLTGSSFPVLAGQDLRDPSVAFVDGHEYLTFFTGTNTLPASGAWVVRDLADGGTPVRLDGGRPYAAIAAPVVKLPNGQLGAAFYARNPGELVDTAWMAWSSDQGATWTQNRILNGIGAGVPSPEPWIVVDGGNIHFFARWGGSQIAQRSSSNSGLSGWDNPRVAITGCNGRPSTVRTEQGSIIMVCRDTRGASYVGAQVAYSLDHTASWAWGPTIKAAEPGTGIGMAYAAPVEVLRGVIVVPFAMEHADGSADLYITNLAESVNWVAQLNTTRARR